MDATKMIMYTNQDSEILQAKINIFVSNSNIDTRLKHKKDWTSQLTHQNEKKKSIATKCKKQPGTKRKNVVGYQLSKKWCNDSLHHDKFKT